MSELRQPMADSAERLLADISTPETWAGLDQREWDLAGWTIVAEAGLHLAAVPEAAQGAGGDFGDLAHLARIAGYHATPQPLVEAMVAHWLLGLAGAAPQARRLAVPLLELGSVPRVDGKGRVSGTVRRAAWVAEASHWVVPALDADGRLLLAELEASRCSAGPVRGANVAREPRDTVTLDQQSACAPPLPLALDAGDLERALAVVRAQQMAGAMRRALDMTMVYVGDRRQFGRALSKFQAVQHMVAQAATEVAACMCITDAAAEVWSKPQFEMLAGVAKARTSEAVRSVADMAHQCHGAMGFTHECALHFFTRRLWAWRDEYGNEAHWHGVLSAALARAGGYGRLWEIASAL